MDQDAQGVDIHRQCHPGLQPAISLLFSGDTLVASHLERLASSVSKLVDLISQIGIQKIRFAYLSEGFDIHHPDSAPVLQATVALASFEQTTMSERTRTGMADAKLHGKQLERRHSLTHDQRALAMMFTVF